MAHDSHTFRNPRKGAGGKPRTPMRRNVHNPCGKAARQRARARFQHAIERNLPAKLPAWANYRREIRIAGG